MKKLCLFIISIMIILCCTSCKNEQILDTGNLQNQTQSEYMSGEHVAYYLVFNEIIKQTPDITDGIKYIVVDANNTCLNDTKYLSNLFNTYAKEKNITFFMDTKEGLFERNHIKNGEYPNGIIITYQDVKCEQDRLSVQIEIWKSENKYITKEFVVEKIRNEWKIV